MSPTVPSWLEEICHKLVANDASFHIVELMHNCRLDDVLARVFSHALSENHIVETIIISCVALVDDGAHAIGTVLASSISIRKLQLRDIRNAREMITFFTLLLRNDHLEEVSLRHCEITRAGAEALAKFLRGHPRLREVRITDCHFRDEDSLDIICQGLQANRTIQRLFMVGNSIDERHIGSISRMVAGSSCLRELYLNENDLGDAGVAILSEGVRRSTSLRLLDVSSNQITSRGALALQGMIISNQYLLSLNLSGNRLGNVGVLCLARGLRQPSCILRCLDLDANGIDAIGARHLAAMLRRNVTLRELKVSFNTIGDDGARSIATALTYNHTLHRLSLRRNHIGHIGAIAFAQKLPNMRGLRELLLAKNHIDQDGIVAFVHSLRSNMDLEYLSVEEKVVSEPWSREILQLLRLNQAGRRIFRDHNQVPSVLWPRIYSRICSDPNILYHFVKEKPDVCLLPVPYD